MGNAIPLLGDVLWTVSAYIETLQRQAAAPTVKQHMAAIRMLFSWLTEKGVLAMNPAREVKAERFSRTEGKTPAFVDGEVQRLLNAVETSTHTGRMCCNFVVEPKAGVDDRHFSSSPRTDRE
jgi:site-specific recombinase XerD